MGFFCGMTGVFVLVSFCCHVYEFIKMADWQTGLRDLVLCNLKREVGQSVRQCCGSEYIEDSLCTKDFERSIFSV